MLCNAIAMEKYRKMIGDSIFTANGSDLLESACVTVDKCVQVINEQVDRYIDEKIREVPAFVVKALFEKTGVEEIFHRLVTSDYDLICLQRKVITVLKQEYLPGGYYEELKPQPVPINTGPLNDVFSRTRAVISDTKVVSGIEKWASEKVLGLAMQGIPGEEILGRFIGGIFQKTFEEARQAEETALIHRLYRSVAGLLETVGSQIKEQLSYKVAVLVYSDYDLDGEGSTCEGYENVNIPA